MGGFGPRLGPPGGFFFLCVFSAWAVSGMSSQSSSLLAGVTGGRERGVPAKPPRRRPRVAEGVRSALRRRVMR